MKEQALKIVTDLIDSYKIKGEDAVILIQAILKESNPLYPSPIQVKDVITPHSGTITTTVVGNVTDNINATRPEGMEVIYG